jgi:hypothetical protein
MAEAFQNHLEASFISGGEYGIDLHDHVEYANSFAGPITPRSILFEFVPAQHATFVRREALEKTGGMRVEVDMCADIDLWYRASHFAPGYSIPNMLAAYQLHPDQRTATSPKWFPNLVKMVESCEQNPVYGGQFKLTADERRNLYTYWEINWTAKRNLAEARPIALRKLLNVLSYSPRTRRTILGATVNPLVRELLPTAVLQRLGHAATAPILPPGVDLTWWKS